MFKGTLQITTANDNSILLLAGEPSGDIQASRLIESIHAIDPSINFFGLGGDLCRQNGMEIIEHVKNLALMGFLEVIPAIPRLKKLQRDLITLCKKRKPKVAILVDYPGFNLSLAPRLKKLGIKTVYFISPQFWAWHESRVKKVEKCIDKMIVILPFEKAFYEKHNVDVEYVGHPFVDIVKPEISEVELRKKYDIKKAYILLMPGSRKQEVQRHLTLMLDIIDKEEIFKNFDWAILKSTNIDRSFFEETIVESNTSRDVRIIDGNNYAAMHYAKFALVASGSATLECAVSGTPLFVIYRTSTLSYLMARSMVLIDFIGLVNLVAGKEIAPEFIQNDANSGKISRKLADILSDESKYQSMRDEILKVSSRLGDGGASNKAAKIIFDIIRSN